MQKLKRSDRFHLVLRHIETSAYHLRTARNRLSCEEAAQRLIQESLDEHTPHESSLRRQIEATATLGVIHGTMANLAICGGIRFRHVKTQLEFNGNPCDILIFSSGPDVWRFYASVRIKISNEPKTVRNSYHDSVSEVFNELRRFVEPRYLKGFKKFVDTEHWPGLTREWFTLSETDDDDNFHEWDWNENYDVERARPLNPSDPYEWLGNLPYEEDPEDPTPEEH